MNTTAQALVDPNKARTSVAVKTASKSEAVSFIIKHLASSMQAIDTATATSEAIKRAPGAIYTAATMNESDRQIARLNKMRGAKPGWAGPGSEAPSEKSLDSAIDLINRLRHLPLPTPMASIGAHGNAGLFWSDSHLYADVEILSDGRVGYLLQVKDGEEIDSEGDIPAVGLPPELARAFATAYLSNRR